MNGKELGLSVTKCLFSIVHQHKYEMTLRMCEQYNMICHNVMNITNIIIIARDMVNYWLLTRVLVIFTSKVNIPYEIATYKDIDFFIFFY